MKTQSTVNAWLEWVRHTAFDSEQYDYLIDENGDTIKVARPTKFQGFSYGDDLVMPQKPKKAKRA